MSQPDRDAAAKGMANHGRRPSLVCARRARGFSRLADKLAEIISGAPIGTPHAGERWRDHSPLAGEERRDETPPVSVGGSAMQEYEAGLPALAPGKRLDLRALDRDK